jgi:DNA polymerase-3 subunit gamma/tau
MSYQVLARKYRPASFHELEGQEHVLQALINSLDRNKLHQAYLFAGTRGVGKTTIARILAKCLNCEVGVTATPCGECGSCREIAEGRSVDLIEVDAASRTGVDDMRELLENVQYMPTVSRFKVYLIDEVHMLSKNSFNAMLKTLEEPPEHVKFLFATTDPKKLPITVLSRCLQFNLKNMSPEQVVNYLAQVLPKESIEFEQSALWLLARAADGSMRDALSLTDQAISYGDNAVTEQSVKSMLGSIEQQDVYGILDAIVAKNTQEVLAQVNAMAAFAPDFSALLDDLLAVLHRVTIAQLAPDAIDNSHGDKELVLATATMASKEDVQLLYQIGVNGQRDLSYAPDDRTGFEMTLLRMIAFTPLEVGSSEGSSGEGNGESPIAAILSALRDAKPGAEGVSTGKASQTPKDKTVEQSAQPEVVVNKTAIVDQSEKKAVSVDVEGESPAVKPPIQEPPEVSEKVLETHSEVLGFVDLSGMQWTEILSRLALAGVTQTLASNCSLAENSTESIRLRLSEQHASLWNKTHEERIAKALAGLIGREIRVEIEIGLIEDETPAQLAARQRNEIQAQAEDLMNKDSVVQTLIENFNGKLDQGSITPIQSGDQP